MSESEYTTVIIAAVPASDDPIHEVVTEDAHVTMHFFGEQATLDSEVIDQIKADLELVASNLYPFPADLSGTAVLGEDKAQVVLVQSEPLTKIRELLSSTQAVSTALANAEQYPNWLPHLTLSYEDTAPDVSGYESFMVGSLALWVGEEQFDYPLSKPGHVFVDDQGPVSSALIAAVSKYSFDASLHPRGADGRFIDKFGIVKYLTPQGWSYGKVDGIYADDLGQTKLTITPSDLSGKGTGAAALELTPNRLYRAPKAKAHLTVGDSQAQKIGGQGGSNPGGMYAIPSLEADYGIEPEKFYVKTPKTKSHGRNEELANLLYEEAGVPVPEVDLAADGQLYSKIVEGQQDMASQLSNPAWAKQVQANFAVDAWLGNRDVFGMTYDNILTDSNGVPWRIDNGGALLYRAMGGKKEDFGSAVTELDSFRQGKKSAVYGPSMSKAQEIDGAERVLAILPGRIEEMVAEASLPKSLADTLKARRLYIADYYGLPLPESQKAPEAQEGSSAPLVDAADLAANKGKKRAWFKVKLNQAAFLLQTGDVVELPDGGSMQYGVDATSGTILSALQAGSQLLGWQQDYGADAEVFMRKSAVLSTVALPRPEHESALSAVDLSGQTWQRGDKIVDTSGKAYRVLGANASTGAVLVQHGDDQPRLLDTLGADAGSVWTVQRWDPPAPKTVETPQDDELASYTSQPDGSYAETPAVPVPAPEKTGQAVEVEAALKDDLETPLPTGNGAPQPKPDANATVSQSGKGMVIGDGSVAEPGAQLVSKKDGKTYEFLKKKGQYAVVTDPNDPEEPDKPLLKLASTMTQPGATPVVDSDEVQKPTTATGEVPAVGMSALAKDGHAGTITMVSPDGKFVFITDANGKKKRKSTGTVSITAGAQPVDTAPKTMPGPVKSYAADGGPTTPIQFNGANPQGYYAADIMDGWEMVLVSYADGTQGLEPYNAQPVGALATNSQGKLAVYGTISSYTGPIAASQLIQAAAAADNPQENSLYTVVWNGTLNYANGTTGPNGGLVLWAYDDFNGYALELPTEPDQVITILDITDNDSFLPPFDSIPSAQTNVGNNFTIPLPVLYGDEAKSLSAWKTEGALSVGQQISLDGTNWLTVTDLTSNYSIQVADFNGVKTYLDTDLNATFVLKAPALTDAETEAVSSAPAVDNPLPEVTDLAEVTDDSELKLAKTAGSFYPGVSLSTNTAVYTVVSYPEMQDDGSWNFLVMVDNDTDLLMLMKTSYYGPDYTMTVDFAPESSAAALGIDPNKANAIWAASKTAPTETPKDHFWTMAQQGLEFGQTQYPIYYNEADGSYYRQGADAATEGWFNGEWMSDTPEDISGMEKVWDGATFTGELKLKGGTLTLYDNDDLKYKPKPGEIVKQFAYQGDLYLASYPNGVDGPGYLIINDKTGQTPLSENSLFTDVEVIHDPFNPVTSAEPKINHEAGPQPPSVLGQFFQEAGYTPQPGAQFLVRTSPNGMTRVYRKQENGDWLRLLSDGSDGVTTWSTEDLEEMTSGGNGEMFGWTYAPEGVEPYVVPGMPEGYAPFVPGTDQSILKVTLNSGKQNVYLQKQPGAGWYQLDNDGTVNESSGAVKGDAAVKKVLAAGGKTPTGAATYELLYPQPETPTAETTTDVPSFDGYTPSPGEEVLSWTSPTYGTTFYVHVPGTDEQDNYWQKVGPNGELTGAYPKAQIDNLLDGFPETWTKTWPVSESTPAVDTAAAGNFNGYQTETGDNVISMSVNSTSVTLTLVQKGGTGPWTAVEADGTLSIKSTGTYTQDTIDWAKQQSNYSFSVLQGTDGAGGQPEEVDTGGDFYAGVAQTTALKDVNWSIDGGYTPLEYETSKLNGLILEPGESAWVNTISGYVYKRTSAGEWHYVFPGNDTTFSYVSDEAMHAAEFSDVKKIVFDAPTQAPQQNPAALTVPITGWAAQGVPAPSTFTHLGSSADLSSAKAGDWVFLQGMDPKSGMFGKVAQGYEATSDSIWLSDYAMVSNGKTGSLSSPNSTVQMPLSSMQGIYLTNVQEGTATPAVQDVPAPASSEPLAAPAAPIKPSYPGALLPSQEDVNAWGGKLTKDGHIPAPGMFVSGKGPMSGKIISVSKDKSKATVLTSDGSKTVRLIEALKTDKTANYQAYAAPVTLKDVPADLPLAVDTPAEVMQKTVKDGKFRAILSGHPGVSQGQMVVTKAVGPSGKAYSRVHLTLTPAQRAQLTASLSGTVGAKGDWDIFNKQSQLVAVGDELPMRKSSTDNPDGTPRWKVDPETKPPTHTVVSVEDDPAGGGIKLVTMKNKATGEEITSRFHPGKSLQTYTWNPDKPKPVPAGAFNLNEIAVAEGWQKVHDGGISAMTGGAQNAVMYNEPGSTVTKSAMGQVSHSWETLRNVSENGVVIELIDPKGSAKNSSTGVTVISVPEGLDEKALGGALSKLGIDYSPMTQEGAKTAVRGLLRTLLDLDISDVDTPKHYSDEALFSKAGQSMGISDLGWQDVSMAVDESSGKLSFFWSQRAQTALASKVKYDLVYRAASTGTAAQIVSTVKYGSASSVLKKTTGMLDGAGGTGGGVSASSDNANHAGHGSYASASKVSSLPTSNSSATYKSPDMMVYHRPEAVLGRIMDYRVANNDAFGMGQGSGANHLDYAVKMSSVKDYFLGGGLPSEAIGFIAVRSDTERTKALAQLASEGITQINGRPVKEIVILLNQASSLKPADLPPVIPPANARPILDLPMSYDAPAEVAA